MSGRCLGRGDRSGLAQGLLPCDGRKMGQGVRTCKTTGGDRFVTARSRFRDSVVDRKTLEKQSVQYPDNNCRQPGMWRWRKSQRRTILGAAFCASRQEELIPGALSILKGAVPVRTRGFGYTAPTYFVGTRDRHLHRLCGSPLSLPVHRPLLGGMDLRPCCGQ